MVAFVNSETSASVVDCDPGRQLQAKPGGAYMFPKLDPEIYPIKDDQEFIQELLVEQRVPLGARKPASSIAPDHFRVVFLAEYR